MKCIKNIENGKISRVRDGQAQARVNSGGHEYVSKSEWKEWESDKLTKAVNDCKIGQSKKKETSK